MSNSSLGKAGKFFLKVTMEVQSKAFHLKEQNQNYTQRISETRLPCYTKRNTKIVTKRKEKASSMIIFMEGMLTDIISIMHD